MPHMSNLPWLITYMFSFSLIFFMSMNMKPQFFFKKMTMKKNNMNNKKWSW